MPFFWSKKTKPESLAPARGPVHPARPQRADAARYNASAPQRGVSPAGRPPAHAQAQHGGRAAAQAVVGAPAPPPAAAAPAMPAPPAGASVEEVEARVLRVRDDFLEPLREMLGQQPNMDVSDMIDMFLNEARGGVEFLHGPAVGDAILASDRFDLLEQISNISAAFEELTARAEEWRREATHGPLEVSFRSDEPRARAEEDATGAHAEDSESEESEEEEEELREALDGADEDDVEQFGEAESRPRAIEDVLETEPAPTATLDDLIAQQARSEARRRNQDEARQRSEQEARQRAEEERETARRAQEEARHRAEEEEQARRRAEEEARVRAEEETRARAREEAASRAQEEAKRREEEEARQRAVLEEKLRAEEEARSQMEAAARQLAEEAEAEARRRAEELEARRRADELEEARRAEEEARQAREAEARRRAEEEEARQAREAEARRRAEIEARQKQEEEARSRREEQVRRRAEEEEKAKQRAEVDAKQRLEEESKNPVTEFVPQRDSDSSPSSLRMVGNPFGSFEFAASSTDVRKEDRTWNDQQQAQQSEDSVPKRNNSREALKESRRNADSRARQRADDEARRRAEEEEAKWRDEINGKWRAQEKDSKRTKRRAQEESSRQQVEEVQVFAREDDETTRSRTRPVPPSQLEEQAREEVKRRTDSWNELGSAPGQLTRQTSFSEKEDVLSAGAEWDPRRRAEDLARKWVQKKEAKRRNKEEARQRAEQEARQRAEQARSLMKDEWPEPNGWPAFDQGTQLQDWGNSQWPMEAAPPPPPPPPPPTNTLPLSNTVEFPTSTSTIAPPRSTLGPAGSSSRGSSEKGRQYATLRIKQPYSEIEDDIDRFKSQFIRAAAQATGVPPHRIRVRSVRCGGADADAGEPPGFLQLR
mmetsp:Transcript_159107/g.305177  ORF Transcript_159107/g.305177 Transcript_159107/m.305177 type:complete len:887 (+) Transcript_159107:50-2710(+)